ncbi:MAG: dicarboxylate/amino acid:cation symporter [Gemmatimonadaceae bacterium]
MSSPRWILGGLLAGLALGALLSAGAPHVGARVGPVLDALGLLWVNAIRMTVVPLVLALVVVSVGSVPDVQRVGRLGLRALIVCLALLLGAAVVVALVVPPLLQWLPLDAAAVARLREGAAPAVAAARPALADWIGGLLPANPVKAAAEGALLPLVLFAMLAGLALTRVDAASRDAVLRLARGVADTMLVLVRWVLLLAPMGVFALAVPLAIRAGLGAAGAMAWYIAIVAAVSLVLVAGCLAVAVIAGGVPLRRLLAATTPPATVAFSTRSSLAALPALVEAAQSLGFPRPVTAFFLPLAVATFKLAAVVAMILGPLFLARLYGIHVGPGGIATIALTAVLLSFSVPGVPAGVILVMAPVLATLGIPAAGLGILVALDIIPDMFRTMANVVADLSAAAVLARGDPGEV